MPDAPIFHVTPTRPGNFGSHVDFKINIDNWFEENRYPPLTADNTTSTKPTSGGLTSTSSMASCSEPWLPGADSTPSASSAE